MGRMSISASRAGVTGQAAWPPRFAGRGRADRPDALLLVGLPLLLVGVAILVVASAALALLVPLLGMGAFLALPALLLILPIWVLIQRDRRRAMTLARCRTRIPGGDP